MAFYELPTDEEITPEARRWLDELRRLRGIETIPPWWRAYGRAPGILEARVTAEAKLSRQVAAFSWEARLIAFMLVAHSRRCDGCFGSSRIQLTSLGFDEPALDGFCANPAALPLPERERLFVRYVPRIVTDSTQVRPKDFREMEAQGFSAADARRSPGSQPGPS